MPRISLRKSFLYLLAVTSCLFFALNVHQRELWIHALASQVNSRLPSTDGSPTGDSTTASVALLATLSEKPDKNGVTNATPRQVPDPNPISTNERLWFMKGGSKRPKPAVIDEYTGIRNAKLWPTESLGDRIVDQLMFVPPVEWSEENPADNEIDGNDIQDKNLDTNFLPKHNADVPLKKILLYNGINSWAPAKPGRGIFLKSQCPVDTCVLTTNKADANVADAILFKDHFTLPWHRRSASQVWILYFLECPYHTPHFKYADVFNWTATYRRDSDIVAPYESWQYYDPEVKTIKQKVNYAANKTRQVAWFVSNCGARNNRLQYAHDLQKHIGVDIYGACGTMKCPRYTSPKCFEMLDRDYKFYLAFENSNCKDYITEKFFVNGLGRNVIPIVMGARPEDYEESSPYKSYIHVDDFESPKHLAEYLHKLDKNDDLYNEYFGWKGTGEFINTYFFCRMCAMLHDKIPEKHYSDINEWWRGHDTCTKGSWR